MIAVGWLWGDFRRSPSCATAGNAGSRIGAKMGRKTAWGGTKAMKGRRMKEGRRTKRRSRRKMMGFEIALLPPGCQDWHEAAGPRSARRQLWRIWFLPRTANWALWPRQSVRWVWDILPVSTCRCSRWLPPTCSSASSWRLRWRYEWMILSWWNNSKTMPRFFKVFFQCHRKKEMMNKTMWSRIMIEISFWCRHNAKGKIDLFNSNTWHV